MLFDVTYSTHDFAKSDALGQPCATSHNQPIAALERETEIDTKRYQYWAGASGKRYICTVFKPNACPNVKSAVYIAVHRDLNGYVTPVSVGHFNSPFITGGKHSYQFGEALNLGANEIHLHLLADDPYEVERISSDICGNLFPADAVA